MISPEQTSAKKKKKPSTKPKQPSSATQDIFMSSFTKGLVLVLILIFNVMVLKQSFLQVAPDHGFSGDIEIDAILYGIAISILMLIILFHEENWQNPWCPGAITLYLDAIILVLYTRWFHWFLGEWGTLWLMRGILVILPVLGLFIMVVMLKRREE